MSDDTKNSRWPTGHTTAPWKITALARCPLQYFLSGVQKDERRKDGSKESRTGKLLHHGLEIMSHGRARLALGKSADARVNATEFLAAIDYPSQDPAVETARLDLEALAEARTLAKKIARNVDLGDLLVEDGRPLVEEPWTLGVAEGVVVGGIWDFVRCRDGRIVVVDWKTGGDVRSSDELRIDPAATLYAAAAHARWPEDPVRVEHFYLTRGFAVGIDWTPEVDEWARAVAREHARGVKAFEKAGRWPAIPSVKACGFCPHRLNCEAYQRRVTTGMGLGAYDPAREVDVEVAVRAFAKADEDQKLAERRKRDLAPLIEPLLERVRDELVVGGHRVRMAKRATPRFPDWRHTLRRLSELTGVPTDELEERLLAVRTSALEDLLVELGFEPKDRERIRGAIEETGTPSISTWLEVKPLSDPIAAPDVEGALAASTDAPAGGRAA